MYPLEKNKKKEWLRSGKITLHTIQSEILENCHQHSRQRNHSRNIEVQSLSVQRVQPIELRANFGWKRLLHGNPQAWGLSSPPAASKELLSFSLPLDQRSTSEMAGAESQVLVHDETVGLTLRAIVPAVLVKRKQESFFSSPQPALNLRNGPCGVTSGRPR